MPELKERDDTVKNPKGIPRHKQRSAIDDEYETPDDLYYAICKQHDIVCELDAFAEEWVEDGQIKSNSKCLYYYSMNDSAFEHDEWLLPDGRKPTGVWVNDPHTLHAESLAKMEEQWLYLDLDIITIIPANCIRPWYWHDMVGKYKNKGVVVEPYVNMELKEPNGYINFKKRGKDTIFSSRNGYLIIRYYSKESWKRYVKKTYNEMRTR